MEEEEGRGGRRGESQQDALGQEVRAQARSLESALQEGEDERKVRRTLVLALLTPPVFAGSGSRPAWTYAGRAELRAGPGVSEGAQGERGLSTSATHLLMYRTMTPIVSAS